MAEEVGFAFVSILPSLKGFTRKLKAELKAALATVDPSLDLHPQVDRGEAARAGREASAVAEAAAPPVNLRVALDRANLRNLISSAVPKLSKLLVIGGVGGAGAAAISGLASAAAGAIPALVGLGAVAVNAAGALVVLPGTLAVVGLAVGTLKIGLSGLSGAFKALASGDVDKLNEALKGLAPSAAALVREFGRLQPAVKALKLNVQQKLLDKTDKTLKALAKRNLPTVAAGFASIATVLNREILGALNALNTEANRSVLASLFDSTARTVTNLGQALRPVGQALLDVLRVGGQLTAELAHGLGDGLAGIAAHISELAKNGGLREIFENGLRAIGTLVELGKDLFGILGGIAKAAGSSDALFSLFGRLNDVINSAAGQSALQGIFSSLASIGAALTPVLLALLQALVPVAKAIGVIAVAFAPVLTMLADALGPALASLAPGFLALAQAVAGVAGALQPLADILVNLVAGLGPGLAVFVNAFAQGLEALVPVAKPVGEALGNLLGALAPLLPTLGQALAAVLAPLAAVLTQLSIVLRPVITALARGLAGALAALLPPFTELVRQTAPIAVKLADGLARALIPIAPAFVQIATALADAFLPHIPELVAGAEQLVPLLVQVATIMAGNLADSILAIIPSLPDLVLSLVQLIVVGQKLLLLLLPLIAKVLEFGGPKVIGALAIGINDLVVLLQLVQFWLNFAATVLDRVRDALFGGRRAIESFGSAAQDRIGAVLGLFRSLPGRITSALGDLGKLLFNAGRNVVQGLIDGIKSMFGKLSDTASSLAGTVRDFLPFSPAKRGPLSGSGAPFHSGEAIAANLADGMTAQLATVRSASDQLAGAVAVGGSGGSSAGQAPAPVLTMDFSGSADDGIIRAFAEAIRIRNGGNVQAALGSN